ncbi:chloramphenicol-sensitive protein RarD [Pseudonocardia thermophila]|uniref:Chloramphenicol-sensitive protein RarD n=1 Tax=Pseudonocardia thermophila TaxID=1848 RepID=A0A1M6TJE5_PSETH|nr:chloramphenicol-sensitive protein RarD [Pseudonocardia thermophila]
MPPVSSTPPDRRGVLAAVLAYALWGLFPAFWALMAPASSVEVLAHRIAWTAVLMVVVLSLVRGWGDLRRLSVRGWALALTAGCLIAVNWGLFVYSVLIGHVVEVALGYFMSPLVNVLLGVVVLRERMRAVQWVAVVLALAAVVVIATGSTGPPWTALGLALSFGVYGLVKRVIPLAAVPGLTAESLAVGPLAVAVAIGFELTGLGTFTTAGPLHAALLIAGGPVTAVPLLLFAFAARRVPLTVLGVLMYVNPVLQFLWGVLVVGETMPLTRWLGFALVWIALVIFTVDLVRHSREEQAITVGDPGP